MSTSFDQSKKPVLPIQFYSCLMYLEDKCALHICACHRTDSTGKSTHHAAGCLERYRVSAGSIFGTKISRWPAFCCTLGGTKLICPTFLHIGWTWHCIVVWIMKEFTLIHAPREPHCSQVSQRSCSAKQCLLPAMDTEQTSASTQGTDSTADFLQGTISHGAAFLLRTASLRF